ncbi:ubiquitin-protein transferase activating protein [Homalodisca vitripennis]|nr:ubiquitin-protein transferase activating protein [Homalodisca vitripennis]
MNISLNASKSMFGTSVNTSTSKTPKKHGSSELAHQKKTPSKTPSKTPRKSPRSTAGTPSGGDRFIPLRSASNFDICHFQMMQQQNDPALSPTQMEMQKAMSENLHGRDISNTRVLAFQKKAPAPPEGYTNPLKVVYSQSKTPMSSKGATRYIPQAPDRILDAPEIVDDYSISGNVKRLLRRRLPLRELSLLEIGYGSWEKIRIVVPWLAVLASAVGSGASVMGRAAALGVGVQRAHLQGCYRSGKSGKSQEKKKQDWKSGKSQGIRSQVREKSGNFDVDLNLIDWSANNVLAVALGSSVYLWNATTGNIDQLMELEGTDYVCSLSWIQEGNMLAVGTFQGPVQVRSDGIVPVVLLAHL